MSREPPSEEPPPRPEEPPPLPPPLAAPPQEAQAQPTSTESAIVLWDPVAPADSAATQNAVVVRGSERPTVRQWLQSLPSTELAAVTQDYGTFLVARDEWLSSLSPAVQSSGKKNNRNLQRLTKMDHRIAVGME